MGCGKVRRKTGLVEREEVWEREQQAERGNVNCSLQLPWCERGCHQAKDKTHSQRSVGNI